MTMKGNQKDPEKIIRDHMRNPNSVAAPGSPARILPKLMVWLLLFVIVTHVFYTLKLLSTSQACDDDPFSHHHCLSHVSLSDNHSSSYDAGTGIALPRREIEEMPEKQGTGLRHRGVGIAASAKLWEKRKEYIKIWYKADRMNEVGGGCG